MHSEVIGPRIFFGAAGIASIVFGVWHAFDAVAIYGLDPNNAPPGTDPADIKRVGLIEVPTEVTIVASTNEFVQWHTSLGNLSRPEQLAFANKLFIESGVIVTFGLGSSSYALFGIGKR